VSFEQDFIGWLAGDADAALRMIGIDHGNSSGR
jgi:hypothetical protein